MSQSGEVPADEVQGAEGQSAVGLVGCLDKESGQVYNLADILKRAQEKGVFVVFAPEGTATVVGLFQGSEFFVSRLVEKATASVLVKEQSDERLAREVKEFGAGAIAKAVIRLALFGEGSDEQQEEGEGE